MVIRVAMAYFLDQELARIESHERRAAGEAALLEDGSAPTEGEEAEIRRFAQRLARRG